jgi:hypothetical protein
MLEDDGVSLKFAKAVLVKDGEKRRLPHAAENDGGGHTTKKCSGR